MFKTFKNFLGRSVTPPSIPLQNLRNVPKSTKQPSIVSAENLVEAALDIAANPNVLKSLVNQATPKAIVGAFYEVLVQDKPPLEALKIMVAQLPQNSIETFKALLLALDQDKELFEMVLDRYHQEDNAISLLRCHFNKDIEGAPTKAYLTFNKYLEEHNMEIMGLRSMSISSTSSESGGED